MKKRILSVMLACTILIGSDGVVYATEMAVEQNQVVEQVTEEDITQEEETETLLNEESALEEETVEEETVEEETVEEETVEEETVEEETVEEETVEEETVEEETVEEETVEEEIVTQENEEQIGDLSNIITVTPKIQTPVLKSVTAKSYNTAEIIWQTTNDSPDGYEVYRKEEGTSSYQKIAVTKAGTYTDKTLTVGKKYSYKVRSIKTLSGGNTIYSDYTAQKDVKTTLAVTTVKAASYSYTSIKISWGKVDGASGYDIYRSTSKSGKYSKIAAISDGKTVKYTDKKLTTGNTYYYKLRAYYTSGKTKTYSSYSNISSAKVIPAAPKVNAVSSVNYNTLKIQWKKVSGADGYVLYRSTSKNGKYTKVATIKGAKTLSYKNTKLTTGKTYYYKIRAYQTVKKSKVYGRYSSVKSGTPKPAKVTGVKATRVNANKIKLTWSKVSGAKSYTIYRSTSKNGTYNAVKTGCTSTSYTNSGLKNGTTYYYKIVAVRGKTVGSLSSVVSAKTITVKVKKRLNGIDVSKWQGEIDFNAVKKAGIDAVMIRIYNGYTKDPYFENNYKNAKAAGLNIGVYYYTYATTTQQVQRDAMTVLGILNGRSLQYPIAIDMEDASLLNGLSNTDRTNILWSFCSTIQNNSKYKYALYANLSWLNNYFENSRLAGMPIWIARYCDPSLGHRYTGAGNVFMWQYTSQGTIPGINGYVDMNFVY